METTIQNERENELWRIAKKRVKFRRHLAAYLVINAFLWAMWFMTGRELEKDEFVPWPLWCSLGWGLGIVFSYLEAFVFVKINSIEKEYERLKEKY